jgi:hypothetical protein
MYENYLNVVELIYQSVNNVMRIRSLKIVQAYCKNNVLII